MIKFINFFFINHATKKKKKHSCANFNQLIRISISFRMNEYIEFELQKGWF